MKEIELVLVWDESSDDDAREKEKLDREKTRKFGKFNEEGEWIED